MLLLPRWPLASISYRRMPSNDLHQPMFVGVLPMLLPGGNLPPDSHAQTVNLIANILGLLASNPSYRLVSIVVYVCHYKLAANVLRHFQTAGLGDPVRRCLVKQMGPDLCVSAELTLDLHDTIRSKL